MNFRAAFLAWLAACGDTPCPDTTPPLEPGRFVVVESTAPELADATVEVGDDGSVRITLADGDVLVYQSRRYAER